VNRKIGYKHKIEMGQKLWGDGLQEMFDTVAGQYEAAITELQAKNDLLYQLCIELAKGRGDADEIVERVLEGSR